MRLPRGFTLQTLLEKYGRKKKRQKLSLALIQTWIQSHYDHFGELPDVNSGKLWNEPEENWRAIDMSLRMGSRGLITEGSSLAQLKNRQLSNCADTARIK